MHFSSKNFQRNWMERRPKLIKKTFIGIYYLLESYFQPFKNRPFGVSLIQGLKGSMNRVTTRFINLKI